MSQIKRSFLIAILILVALVIGVVATFIDSHVINVTLKMIVIVIAFVVIVLAFQSRADRRK
ncbi:hypothetical protein [Priestia endophytica]|jgi:Flp pilus assembly protein TadB|uniref:Uncharacterized protein n=1 Tax=Priestia endophytica DSM 13796 TaxID=1121089 RepID=A0A1I6BYE3_9BACI|nr:hypothetical protein [Priestia endophytica]KAB2493428.1 hypothetical protein F8155_14095 [Priestia endophytica]KYG33253.1 hypothetical protein AZF06_22235 [Priestia endophytica]SFQ85956.1 hypothetical protein SAMN02745910_04507 [Priestia endophytica DSM 13796]